jgi:hypothetical protein
MPAWHLTQCLKGVIGANMCNKKTEHFISHTCCVGGVVFYDNSVVITVGTAMSRLIMILLSSLLEFFQYVDLTSACWESNRKPHRPELYALAYQLITYWLEVTLIRTYFSRIKLGHQNIHCSVTRYTRDDKQNCKPLGKMCLAGGLNRDDLDTHRQTSNWSYVVVGGRSVGSECSGMG